MILEAALTIIVTVSVLIALAFTRYGADSVLMAALAFLLVSGVLTPTEALSGFANPGVMTIAVLYIVAAALKESGAIQYIAHSLFGQPGSIQKAQVRMLIPTSLLSAFMNNTAVVSMLIPAVQEWAKRIGVSSSKLLLPLSYATILGGTITLIGTSTNLVVDGLLQAQDGIHLKMFELAWLGIPLTIVGGVFLVLAADKLLPARQGLEEQAEKIREYSVEVEVSFDSHLVGKSIEQAGLRQLQFTYLAEILRDQHSIKAVSPDTILQPGDRLTFIGAAEGANELRQIKGLQPASSAVEKLNLTANNRHLVEVVVGPDFPGLGKSVRDSQFRTHYQAVILSVSREGRRIPGKLGDIKINNGDTLLLEAGQNFVEQYRFRRDFLLVSLLNDSSAPDFRKAPLALFLLLTMVVMAASGLLSILEAALVTAGTMLITGCISLGKARRSVDLSVVTVIAASFALGAAMTKTGVAESFAHLLLTNPAVSPWIALSLVYIATALFTEMITNNAAAILMFPVASAISEQLGVSIVPFAIAVMFAASASFITPLGYQTNLMVMGPGGYQIWDYLKLGLPLSIITAILVITLIPFIWSF